MNIKALSAILALIGAIVGGTLWADERYFHAASAVQMQQAIEQKMDKSVLEIRRWNIEDRLMQIETKPEAQRTDLERAMLERYKRELGTVNRAIARPPGG